MTEVTRVFDVEKRRFLNVERKYCGQQYDSLSTTLHFEYNPIDFLKKERYTAFIIFDVRDDNGNPLIYGLESTPVFNGYTFSIPWDVTSRIKSQRVEYQLYFVSEDYYIYDEVERRYVESGDGTRYLISPRDGIALKPTIGDKKRCCPTMAPSTEPSIVGYINMWKDKGLIGPVATTLDPDTGLYTLSFQTFSGETYDVSLDVNVEQICVLSEDLTVDIPVGGIPAGHLFPKGTLYEDIFRMMLTSEKPVTKLIARYGATTGIPESYDTFDEDRSATWRTLLEDGWVVKIYSGEGDNSQHPAVAVNDNLEIVEWFDTDMPSTNYVQQGRVAWKYPGSGPGPSPTPVPMDHTVSDVTGDLNVSAEFSRASSSSMTFTFDDVQGDHTISVEFEEGSPEPTEYGYKIWYLKDEFYDSDKGGNTYGLRFKIKGE